MKIYLFLLLSISSFRNQKVSGNELQPIETCWAVVKNQIARKSKFTMAHLLEQLDDAFDSVTEETCTGLIKEVREVEDKYWREDAQLDRGQ